MIRAKLLPTQHASGANSTRRYRHCRRGVGTTRSIACCRVARLGLSRIQLVEDYCRLALGRPSARDSWHCRLRLHYHVDVAHAAPRIDCSKVTVPQKKEGGGQMADQAALAIGVQQADKLVALPGAVNGAREFADWAKAHDYRVTLITDERKPVTVNQLCSAIKRILRSDPERLVIYFAGHGTQPTTNTAYWLLSHWQSDPNEAVNVNLSFYHAKRLPIGQIAFLADACRSAVANAELVGGASIFPTPEHPAVQSPQWDHFLAARLGESAQEVSTTKAAAAYGVFTRCLMNALRGQAKAAIEVRPGKKPGRVVSSQALATYLERNVPLESGLLPGGRVQTPDVTSGWRPDKNYYVAIDDSDGDTGPQRPPIVEGSGLPTGGPRSPGSLPQSGSGTGRTPRRRSADTATFVAPSTPPSPAVKRAVTTARRRDQAHERAVTKDITAHVGRETFETRQGLTIIGAQPRRFVVPDREVRAGRNSSVDLFEDRGAWHVRGDGEQATSILIELAGGTWIASCLLPSFVGTILVREGLAMSTSYRPARGGRYSPELPEVTPLLGRFTALMQQGRFGLPKDLSRLAKTLRHGKHGNPALGILAAYAYERAGSLPEIDDIAWWFARARQPVPCDVALLSGSTVRRTRAQPWTLTTRRHGVRYSAPIAGSIPLLTQGWSFLDAAHPWLDPFLLSLRSGLQPSLWTTLTAKAGRLLAGRLGEGRLR